MKKIMIIDDDPVIAKYLNVLFQDTGYATCLAKNGKEAVAIFENEAPDLITLDLEMPEEWGPRFFRKISKKQGFCTPVIVISGLNSIKHSIPKANATFGKPFDPDTVLAKVRELLE